MWTANLEISKKQGSSIFLLETFCGVGMFLPQAAALKSGETGLYTVLLGAIAAVCYPWLVQKAEGSLTMEEVLKKHRVISFLYYVRFFINAAFFYAYMLLLARVFLLPYMNIYWIGLPVIFLAFRMNGEGLDDRARVMEGLFWFILIPFIFILLLSMTEFSVKPFLIRQFEPKNLAVGGLYVLALFHPMELVWFYQGHMKEKGMNKKTLLGIIILSAGVFAATAGSLGLQMIRRDPFPVISMAQNVAMPGGIMARLDIFLIAFWIVGVFCVLSGYLFYGNWSFENTFAGKKKWGRWISYGGLFLITGFLIPMVRLWENYISVFLFANLLLGILIPAVMFWLERRGGTHEKDHH